MKFRLWSAVIKLVTALPTIRMPEVTANIFQNFPEMPELTSPLGLGLVSFRFNSKWVAVACPLFAFLVGGRADGEPLQSYSQPLSIPSADLHGVLSAHGRHLRLLAVSGVIKDPHVLGLYTHLERFECGTVPSDEIVAAIPRTITTLAVTNLVPDSVPDSSPRFGRVFPPPLPVPHTFISVAYLTQQLNTFPNLRALTWVGSIARLLLCRNVAAAWESIYALGRSTLFVAYLINAPLRNLLCFQLSDDEIQFSLRRRLLKI
jgi:hypothetical protein